MIYCVWYPSGGFGHYINAVLSLHGKNFMRPTKQLEFSSRGDSHSVDLVVPVYQFDQWPGFDFNHNLNYSVLVDNGINSQSEQFRTVFTDSTIIRICYTDESWPVVARAMIEKAMVSSLDNQLPSFGTANWAIREKYFLFLRDHELRSCWRPIKNDLSIHIDSLFNYQKFHQVIESCGIKLDDFESTWQLWRSANSQYIDPVQIAQCIINNIKQQTSQDLTSITDIWTQSVIYYFIWLNFGVEVPHNDYADFFKTTEEICSWLETVCVC